MPRQPTLILRLLRLEHQSHAHSYRSRSPVGGGPSGNTWPRWPPQRLQCTSVRAMNSLRSSAVSTAPFAYREEARPPAAALELGVRVEQLLAASGANKDAGPLLLVERARAGPLGRVPAQYRVLPRLEPGAPLGVAVLDREIALQLRSLVAKQTHSRPLADAVSPSQDVVARLPLRNRGEACRVGQQGGHGHVSGCDRIPAARGRRPRRARWPHLAARGGRPLHCHGARGRADRRDRDLPHHAGRLRNPPTRPPRCGHRAGRKWASWKPSSPTRPAAGRDPKRPWLLAPIDLQAIKAAGVTFAVSMIERVIEERARGNPDSAAAIRETVNKLVGDDLSRLKPGSPRGRDSETHADRARFLESVSRSRHRAGRRNLHQGAAAFRDRHRHGCGHPSQFLVEQSRAGSRARGRVRWPRGRGDARQ